MDQHSLVLQYIPSECVSMMLQTCKKEQVGASRTPQAPVLNPATHRVQNSSLPGVTGVDKFILVVPAQANGGAPIIRQGGVTATAATLPVILVPGTGSMRPETHYFVIVLKLSRTLVTRHKPHGPQATSHKPVIPKTSK